MLSELKPTFYDVRAAMPYHNTGRLRWATDENGEQVCYVDNIVFRELLEAGVEHIEFTVHAEYKRPFFYFGPMRAGND